MREHRHSEIIEVISVNHGNDKQDLELVRELGRGNYGEVYLARDDRHADFAVKKVRCEDADSKYNISQELTLLTTLRHDNIIRLYAVDFIEQYCVFVMEYCPKGTLNDRLDWPVIKDTQYLWMQQLCGALEYLHSQNIVHRDLKPDNVLLKEEDVIKLADFGVAREFHGLLQGTNHKGIDNNEYLSEFLMGTFAGTPHWVAPELFAHKYDKRADTFSLGIIFVAIMTRNYTLHENKKHYGAFVESYRSRVGVGVAMSQQEKQIYPDFITNDGNECDPNVVDVVKEMLAYNPSDRISIAQCLKEINDAHFRPSSKKRPTTSAEKKKYYPSPSTEITSSDLPPLSNKPSNLSPHLDIPSSSNTPYSPVSSSDESTARETASLLQSSSNQHQLLEEQKKKKDCLTKCCQNCNQFCYQSCKLCFICFENKDLIKENEDVTNEPFANDIARE